MRKLLVSLLVLLAMAFPVMAFSADAPSLKLKVGDTAPDFTLKNQNGRDVSLHDFRNKKTVVLAFYIFAFSDV